MPINPVLSIIILSYNTRQITLDCLKSVFADKNLEFNLDRPTKENLIPTEIIIIDNNSTDDSVDHLKKMTTKLPGIKLITNSTNLGFAKANNQGIKIARGNYILLLNSDTIILHSAISQSLYWLSSHPESHVCTAQLLNKDKSIQASGGFFPTLSNVFTWSFGLDDLPFTNKFIPPLHPHPPQFYTHDNFFNSNHRQDWVTGAFMLIRHSHLRQVGGFDDNYFMYGEELELSYRLHLAYPKSECWYLVGPQIIHLGGASAQNAFDPILREYTGIISFFKKHRPSWQLPLVKILLKINACLRSIINPVYKQVCSKI